MTTTPTSSCIPRRACRTSICPTTRSTWCSCKAARRATGHSGISGPGRERDARLARPPRPGQALRARHRSRGAAHARGDARDRALGGDPQAGRAAVSEVAISTAFLGQTDAFPAATPAMLASLSVFPRLATLAPVRQPPPVREPMERRLFAREAADVDSSPPRNRLEVLMGESELLGIGRQSNSVRRRLAEPSEAIEDSGLLDFEYGRRSVNRYQDLRAPMLACLASDSCKSLPRILGRMPVEQLHPEITRFERDLT